MFVSEENNGIKLFIRLTPKTKKEGVLGLFTDPNGTERLKVGVFSPPVDGKANQALIKLLSKNLHIAKSNISLIAGETDRNKTLFIHGNSKELIKKLENLI